MCNYDFNLPVDAEPLVILARQAIEEHGGKTEGENGHVTFTIPTPVGDVNGACEVVEPKVVSIRVTKKPDIVPCSVIRQQLVTYLTEAVRIHRQMNAAGHAA